MSALTGASSPPDVEELAIEESAPEEPLQKSPLAGTPAKEELPKEVPWVPRMDAIRKAQSAEVDALEEIVGALASKQQTSVAKLRKQMDAIMAWRAKIIAKERKAAPRREGANATKRVNVAGESVTRDVRTRDKGPTVAGVVVTAPEACTVEGSADETDAASAALVVEDNEDDWSGMPEEFEDLEEPVEQGMCGLAVCTVASRLRPITLPATITASLRDGNLKGLVLCLSLHLAICLALLAFTLFLPFPGAQIRIRVQATSCSLMLPSLLPPWLYP